MSTSEKTPKKSWNIYYEAMVPVDKEKEKTKRAWKWRRYKCKKCGADVPYNWRRMHQYLHGKGMSALDRITDEELDQMYEMLPIS